jgi:hypothetical protein
MSVFVAVELSVFVDFLLILTESYLHDDVYSCDDKMLFCCLLIILNANFIDRDLFH